VNHTKSDLMVKDCLRPNGRVGAYFPIFWQHLVDGPQGPKVGLAALFVVWQAMANSVTVPAVVALLLFWLDFASGIIRAVRSPRETVRWERAADGFLKLGLYFIMWVLSVLAEVLVTATGVNPNGLMVAAACGIIIWMELASIRENIVSGLPEAGAFFDRLFAFLGKGGHR
jgi:hypothetical protein